MQTLLKIGHEGMCTFLRKEDIFVWNDEGYKMLCKWVYFLHMQDYICSYLFRVAYVALKHNYTLKYIYFLYSMPNAVFDMQLDLVQCFNPELNNMLRCDYNVAF